MKNLLKATAALVLLAAMTAALLLVLAPLERSRGQTPALAPTPTSTPQRTPTPTPRPDAPKPDWPVVDPTWNPPPAPTYPILPTPTPLPATGGPYISEAKAIEIAVASGRAAGEVNQSIPPRTLFTRGKEIPAILGKPNPDASSEREYWVVSVYGRFKAPRFPPGGGSTIFDEAQAIIDATTGEITTWTLLGGK